MLYNTTMKVMRGTTARLTYVDPTPKHGQLCVEYDDTTLQAVAVKVGDGIRRWSELEYMADARVVSEILSQLSDQHAVDEALAASISALTGMTAAGNVKILVGTNSTVQSAIAFSDSNGVSFGLNTAGAITASVQAGPGGNNAGTDGAITGGSMTVNTSGITISLPAYLTTAQPPGAYLTTAQPPGAYLTTAQPVGNYLTTAQPPGNYLTTAMASDAGSLFAGTQTSATNASITVNQTGISISVANPAAGAVTFSAGTVTSAANALTFVNENNVSFGLGTGTAAGRMSASIPSFLTTAAATNVTSDRAGTNGSISGGSITVNTSGVTINLPAYLTNIKVSAGTLSANRSDITFANSNSVSFGLNTNGAITASVNVDAAFQLSAGNTSTERQGFTFINSNNVSFGLGGGTAAGQITASIPAFLTTAAATDITSARAGTVTGMTGGSITVNTSGVTISLPAYLTTAAATNVTSDRAGTGTTIATTAGTDLKVTFNTAGLNISYPKWLTTYANDLTSDRAGTVTGMTGGSITVNTSGVTISLPAYLTTAAATNVTSDRAGTGTTLATTAGTDLKVTFNTAGLNISYPKWLTTYVNDLTSGRAGTGTSATNALITLDTNGLAISIADPAAGMVTVSGGTVTTAINAFTFANANNVSFGLGTGASAGSITASIPAYLTTAAATNITSDRAGTVSGATACSVTVNTSGVSVNVPVYAALDVTSARAGTVTGATGCSVTANTSGISVNVNVGAGGVESYWCNADIDLLATGASAITQSSGSSMFVQPFFLPYDMSIGFVRFLASFNDTAVGTGGTTAANSTFSAAIYTTIAVALYSQGSGANSRSIQYMGSTSNGITGSTQYGAAAQGSRYTVTVAKSYPVAGTTSQWTSSYAVSSGSIVISSNSNTLFTGPRYLDINFATSIAAGNYWLAIGASSAAASQSTYIGFATTAIMPISLCAITSPALSWGVVGAATSASDHQLFAAQGVWTTNSSIISTSSIGMANVSQVASNPTLPFYLIRSA